MLRGVIPYNDQDVQKYIRRGQWRNMTIGDILDKAAELSPANESLVDNHNNRFNYKQLREKADRLAIGLIELGIKPRDRVLLQFPNWSEFIYTYFALQKMGAIPVLLLARYAQTEINHLCKLTEAVAWIGPETYRNREYIPIIKDIVKRNPCLKHIILVRSEGRNDLLSLEQLIDKSELTESNLRQLAARKPDPMEVAHMGPTGGSTGLPKVAPKTHNSFLARAEYTAKAWELNSDDVCLVVAPVGHDLSFSIVICPAIFVQTKLVLLDSTEPRDILSIIEREKVTAIGWVPPLAERIVNCEDLNKYDISSLRKMYCGGQNSPPELIQAVKNKLNCKYINGYGGTEGHNTMTRLDYDQAIIHTTVGKPACPYDNYKIIDPASGKDLSLNTSGELVVRGPCIFSGYYNAPKENQAAFTPDGFFRTGDLAMIDVEGNITLTGRIKDIIKRGGENISPIEIENLIITHPDAAQVCVIGMPDPVLAERICAYIQRKPGKTLDFESIIDYLKANGASVLQLPERIEFVDHLPVTEAGKTNKRLLKEDIKTKLIKEGKIKEQPDKVISK
jgi:non-ribosomal peptide synthetase component E (peptide arylation enzyme)